MPPREWNARSYERVSGPQEQWGRDVLDRLELDGDERVLDAGCGTGRVTAALLERLPRGELLAVDGSAAMVEQAQERFGDAVHVFQQDLVDLELDEPVDAILSTATFHWIKDHDRLFAQLHKALKPGGRLVAQCGAHGNVANVDAAARRVDHPALRGWAGPWNFATTKETAQRLTRAGFKDVWTWSQEWPVAPEDPHEFLATVVLGAHLDRLPQQDRDAYVDAVIAELDQPVVVEYVRLNMLARS
jgi:trans-aconitate 2-methyltransferase